VSAPGFLSWAVEALIASSLLMAFVLAVRGHAQRALGPQLAYWLWALPVLRMVMPPLPAEWRDSAVAPISAASEIVMIYLADAPAATASTPVETGLPWLLIVAGLWVAGGIAFFVWHGLAHLDYVRRILSPPARRERMDDGTTYVISDAAVGPVAFGVFRKFVAVPRDFSERYDADERRLALAHELGHHARGDLIANWIGLAMLAVHWFNPLAWVAYRKFRADQEMANDARVLAALPPIERHAYACAIVKAAHGRAVTAACHLHTIEDLKGRLRMLKASRKSRRVLMAGATGIAAMTIAGLGLTASGAAAEKIAATAATQVPMLAAQVAAVPVPPSTVAPPAPPAPVDAKTKKHVVIIDKDGESRRYEGAEADAYLASKPELKRFADGTFAHELHEQLSRDGVLVLRGKDGKHLTELSPEIRAKLKAVERLRVELPSLPPIGPFGRVGPIAPVAPVAPGVRVFSEAGKDKIVVRNLNRRGQQGRTSTYASLPRIMSGDCGDKQKGSMTVNETDKDGKRRIIVCTSRITASVPRVIHADCGDRRKGSTTISEADKDGTRRIIVCAYRSADAAQAQARLGQLRALDGLRHGRAAIEANRSLTDEQRIQALAGIEQARASIEQQMKEQATPN
jgi:beta-lactamase regulating signal transducer with metallopeptidase domain